MSYTALYRKYRPRSFDEVAGQDVVVTTLKNQLASSRVGHAYLFCGTRGTGKTTIAKILARAVNCENPKEDGPCNACATCRAILSGTSTNVIEIDAASNNGVDNIREIREEVAYRPTMGRYKVYIIDEVHMLSTGAFNALLKTLEEPPEYVMFLLATTEVHKIPVTILSRCQRYDLRRISSEVIEERLRALLAWESVEADDDALRFIARAAEGSMRDALSLLDQCVAMCLGERLTLEKVRRVLGAVETEIFGELLACVHAGDAAGSIRILERLIQDGKEIGQFVTDFIWHMRNLLLLKGDAASAEILDLSKERIEELKKEAAGIDEETLLFYIRQMSELSSRIRLETRKRVLVETALIGLCRPQMYKDQAALLSRIRALEDALASGAYAAPAARADGDHAAAKAEGQSLAAEASEPKMQPVRAAAEDLQEIKASWPKIIAGIKGLSGILLRDAEPVFDPADESPVLYLRFAIESGFEYYSKEEHTRELRARIQEVTAKDIPVKAIREGAGDRTQSIRVEDIIAERIGMELTYEN